MTWGAASHREPAQARPAPRREIKVPLSKISGEIVRQPGTPTHHNGRIRVSTRSRRTTHARTMHLERSTAAPSPYFMIESTSRPPDQLAAIQRAMSYAARAHGNQRRKDGITPYIAHPMRVAFIVRDVLGCDDTSTIVGAVLHDIVEDTLGDYDEIAAQFGADVAQIVAAMTKDKRLPDSEREHRYDEQLVAGPWQARVIKLADALDNWTDTYPNATADTAKRWSKVERALTVARSREDTASFADRLAGYLRMTHMLDEPLGEKLTAAPATAPSTTAAVPC